MARQDERRAVLEDFATVCTEVAQGLAPAGMHLDWEHGKDGFVHFHCPLPGLRVPHRWDGAPRASAWMSGGEVKATCSKCVGAKADHPDQAGYEAARDDYTDRIKRSVRWEEGGVVKVNLRIDVLRSHMYFDRDFRRAVRRDKFRFEDGRREKTNRNPWRWLDAELFDGRPGIFSKMAADPWLARNYPECKTIYEALCWYGIERLVEGEPAGPLSAATLPLRPCRVVITEGEKDADSFNALMAAAGVEGFFATCLCHPMPTKLASHHLRLIAGRDVIVVGDADEPGRQHAENWTRLVWDHDAKSIKLVIEQLGLKGTPEEKDLSDWLNLRGGLRYPKLVASIAAELVDLFAATPPLIEPFGRIDDWKRDMIQTQKGGPKSDSPHNAEKVWTQHPALKGRTRINMHTGEVEVVGPPWALGEVAVGAHAAAITCAAWLERTEKMSLSSRVLEDVVRSTTTSPVVNAVEQPVAWDEQPAIGRMLQDVPLDAPAPQVLKLWEILFSDLAAKYAGERWAQRYVLGVVTDKNINLARAIAGRHGAVHAGVVTEAHLIDWARRNLLVVQVEMRTVADERRSLRSMQNLMQPDVWNRTVGRSLPTPLIIAVGPWSGDKRVLDKTSDGCLPLRLDGPVLEDALAADAQAALAEAAARRDELRLLKAPSREQLRTVDEAARLEAVGPMLWAIYHYATKNLALDRVAEPSFVQVCALRSEPLQHIVREQFLNVMRPVLFSVWRGDDLAAHAFNAACRAMGWNHKLGLTRITSGKLGFVIEFGERQKWVLPGLLLDDDKLTALRNKLAEEDDPFSDPSPLKGGGSAPDSAPESLPRFATGLPPQNTRESLGFAGLPEAIYREESLTKVDSAPYARGCAIHIESPLPSLRWISGPEAVAAVRAILSRPVP